MGMYEENLSRFSNPMNIYPDDGVIDRHSRNRQAGHKSGVVWLTGLSGAGKSTIATLVEQELFDKKYMITILDGDTMRSGLNSDLDFSPEARMENLRRSGEVASLLASRGFIVLATFISPFQIGRDIVRDIVGDDFFLVHVHAEMDDVVKRDPKGLYKKAMDGQIENFTGVSQQYQKPHNADLVINTSIMDKGASAKLLSLSIQRNFRL